MAKIITMTIETEGAEAGDATVELDGYKGKGCHAIQEIFAKALGGKTKKLVRKPEYNTPVTTTTCQTR
jgi:hypothetical protein